MGMWPLKLFQPKCVFCKKTDNLQSVVRWYIYNNDKFYYHQECLCEALAHPEAHPNLVDMALQITDLIKEREDLKQAREKKFQENCVKAKGLAELFCTKE